MRTLASLFLTAVFLGAPAGAQPANLSGNWQLNVARSKWGNVNKPVSVLLTIEHQEPKLSYHGSVMYANEDQREFGFSGAIDGKPYPMSRSFGEGEITLVRVNERTIDSTFRTYDGNYIETARTILSRDGRTLERQLRLVSPEGTKKWTEIYERR
ncbi:MAG: hypothetical protein NZR01_15095 [Bryobacteraceae bacterium]|nr:hypothetical protein [Bryobacteraceae bacterium]